MPFLNKFKGQLVDTKKDVWELEEPLLYYDVEDDITYEVPKGFICDLASIPRLPLTWWLFKGSDTHRPGVLHDWRCREKIGPRREADNQFYRALRDEGINFISAHAMWLAVRAYSGILGVGKDGD